MKATISYRHAAALNARRSGGRNDIAEQPDLGASRLRRPPVTMGIKEELQEAGIALLNEDEKKEIVALFNAKLASMGGGGKTVVAAFKDFDDE